MESGRDPSVMTYVGIWVGLLGIVGIETAITYQHPEAKVLLASLLILALVEAAIAMLYFMHMNYERKILLWTLVPITLFVLSMLDHLWADAFRMVRLRLLQ